jgi:hypothetical protein
MISPFSKGFVGVGLGQLILLFGIETMYAKGSFFLGGMGGRSLVVFEGRKVGVFFVFLKNISLVVWDGADIFFPSVFLFNNMMT